MGGDAFPVWGEGGEDEEAPVREGGLEGRFEGHADDGARGNPDNGLATSEEGGEAFAFHGGVEAADEYAPLVSHGGDGVKGFEDDPAGALRGAEEADFCAGEDFGGACGVDRLGWAVQKF